MYFGLLEWVTWRYWFSPGVPTGRTVLSWVLVALAFNVGVNGLMLVAREYKMTHDGETVIAIVSKQLAPTTTNGLRGQYDRHHAFGGLSRYVAITRWVLPGSAKLWGVDYEYACGKPRPCVGHDHVPEAVWRTLPVGTSVTIRHLPGAGWSRLESNSQSDEALGIIAIAMALLIASFLVDGPRISARRHRYITAQAVVTTVEDIGTDDAPRWRVSFAYLDPKGFPHESFDEVIADRWKSGDECVAVFPPDRPHLGSLRPVA